MFLEIGFQSSILVLEWTVVKQILSINGEVLKTWNILVENINFTAKAITQVTSHFNQIDTASLIYSSLHFFNTVQGENRGFIT